MGIYSNGKVYGIRWYIKDEYDEYIIYYEQKYETELTPKNIQEIKEKYDDLSNMELSIAKFSYYTKCTSTIDIGSGSDNFMSWFPSDKNMMDKILNGKMC